MIPIRAMAEPEPSQAEDVDSDVLTEEDRPWRVIVWNDPINLMNYVTYVFKALFGFSDAKATSLMLDVHEKGRAVVSGGTRAESEKDVHNLHAYGLWATMEHDS